MNHSEIKTLAELGWTKRWAGAFSILCASYFGDQYTTACKSALGAGFSNIFFAHKNGATTCYRVKSETSVFGDHLVALALEDAEVLSRWSQQLKVNTDALRSILDEPIENFLELKKYLEFEWLFEKYGPAQFAVTTAPNFLPPQLLDSHLSTLEDARRYSEALYNETEDFFRKLCNHIGSQAGLDGHFVACLYHEELKDFLVTHKLPMLDELQRRFSGSGLYFNNGRRTDLNREETLELEKNIADRNGLVPGIVKGTPASPGVAAGTVRIVPDPRTVQIFNDGDILITGMTRPDFVPLMKKAGAIVTDAGGLLCHAAIVSRELGKPCVIATEVATKAFKDGDLVQVDAITGVVKKI